MSKQSKLRDILDILDIDTIEIDCPDCLGQRFMMVENPKNEPDQRECEHCYATGKVTDLTITGKDQAITHIREMVESKIGCIFTTTLVDDLVKQGFRDGYKQVFEKLRNQTLNEILQELGE